ncbi:uncharacterized protein si:ch211-142k18.1 [Cololabis saira]|uniref:uncharacterized protein si:ch211-142k18.1 n=1 Tax=Cololabis saira TaxID=129043 RepID=UPI002AD26C68|nr:uncharacterized protein si:ch211-142k18.1 [Cololabis saira]XP_061602674.1 uncharacterized protein si:ch211-142k18.1 [Cololabis saira]
MWHYWMKFILAWVSIATPILGQSGNGDWGSGFDNDTFQTVGDEPVKVKNDHDWSTWAGSVPSPSPSLHHEPRPDMCSVHFSTNAAASARRMKAQREELAYLQAIQHGNKAIVENLEQFVGAELGNQTYEDMIKENIFGIQEDHKNCSEVVEKAEEDLKKQLEGDISGSVLGMQKIKEESLVFEDMLRTATDIARRLESSSQALHASFTRQLKDIVKIYR